MIKLSKFQREVHENAKEKGFWDPDPRAIHLAKGSAAPFDGYLVKKEMLTNSGEKIALMHSELSEGLEGERNGNGPSDKIPKFNQLEEELSDVIIRILDYAEHKGLNIEGAIVEKHEYNKKRPYKHNKNF